MVALSGILGAITALPTIVSGVDSVISALGGTGGAGRGTEIDPATGAVVSTGTSVGPTLAAFPGISPPLVQAQAGGAIGRILPPLAGAVLPEIGRRLVPGGPGQTSVCRPVSVVQGILMRSRAATGRPVTANKIRDAARHCGIDQAAAMFGITIQEVCHVVIARRRRRARGISAADLRRTRSTIRKVGTIRKDLKALAR